MSAVIRWLLVVSVGLGLTMPAHAKRIALVMGNANYKHIRVLESPRNDAQAVAGALKEFGFEVLPLVLDADRKSLIDAVHLLRERVSNGDEVVIYYSGHAVELNGTNHLLPVDAPPLAQVRGLERIVEDAIRLQRFLEVTSEKAARFTLAIFDACRDDPIQHVKGGTATGGLAAQPLATGQMVMYAAGSKQLAKDKLGPEDRHPNSLFTRVLLDEMRRPGISAAELAQSVRTRVAALARSIGHEQVPASYDQAEGSFVFSSLAVISGLKPGNDGPTWAGQELNDGSQPTTSRVSVEPGSDLRGRNPSIGLQGVSGFDTGGGLPSVSPDMARKIAALFSIPRGVDAIYVFYQQIDGSKLGQSTGEDPMGAEEFLRNVAAIMLKAKQSRAKLIITARTKAEDWTIVNTITYRGEPLNTHRYFNFGLRRVFDGKEVPLDVLKGPYRDESGVKNDARETEMWLRKAGAPEDRVGADESKRAPAKAPASQHMPSQPAATPKLPRTSTLPPLSPEEFERIMRGAADDLR